MKAEQTKEYFRFKILKSNRMVDERHLKKLVQSIQDKNLLHVNPIVVNKAMEIIDGQHRYFAAKELNVPLYYVIADEISESDISRLNSVKKDWKPLDYINYYRAKKKAGFDVVWEYYRNNMEFGITNILKLLADDTSRSISADLKDGYVDVSNKKRADEVLEIVKSFSNYPFYKSNKFIYAIAKVHATGKYDHYVMKEKLAKQPRSFVQCVNTEQYVEMIEEIYNYHSSKNRVSFKSK